MNVRETDGTRRVSVVLQLALFLVFGCTESGGGDGAGGRPGGGGVATGGMATGGVATGGVATGGVATGGLATGGVATGGLATGGMVTGGMGAGGDMPPECDAGEHLEGGTCVPDECVQGCMPRATRCSADALQRCEVDADGCWGWSEAAPCAPLACADAVACEAVAPGVRVEQWGTTQDDLPWAVAVDPAGAVFVGGATSGDIAGQMAQSVDSVVYRRNEDGTPAWSSLLGSPMRDVGQGLVVVGNEVFVVGPAGSLGDGQMAGSYPYLAALDAGDGAVAETTRWATTQTEPQAVGVAKGGGFMVAGWTNRDLDGDSAGGLDGFLSYLDAGRQAQWTRQWGSDEDDRATELAVDASSGAVYLAGYTTGDLAGDNAGAEDAFLTKFDASGVFQWSRQWGTALNDRAWGLAVVSGGGVLVGGRAGTSLGGAGSGGAFLRKFDPDGNALWTQQWGPASAAVVGVAENASGEIIAAGYAVGAVDEASAFGQGDVFVSKWVDAGATRTRSWTKQFGTGADEVAQAFALGADGTIYVVGYTRGAFPGYKPAGDADNFLLTLED